MFTGIVEDRGKIKSITNKGKDKMFAISPDVIDLLDVVLGESIAVNGACLTVTSIKGGVFTVDASRETLSRTNLGLLKSGSAVNLERSLKVGGRLGGHIVNGHVDGVGAVKRALPVGESVVYWISAPNGIEKYIVEKGSVAVNGVSLTVNEVSGNRFSINIIPYTRANTTFSKLKVGDSVNIECDILGKYVERLLGFHDKKTELLDLLDKL